jgi:hypothetical protein
MPAITSTNKNYFKLYLKEHRKKFTSPLQQINLSDIQNVFVTTSDTLTIGTQTVKVGLFGGKLGDEELDISSLSNGELLYLPGAETDYVKLKTDNTDNYATLYFASSSGDSRLVLNNGGYNTLSLNETINIGAKNVTVKAFGGLLLSVEDAATYTITHNANVENLFHQNFITEGDSITFNITTTNFGTNGNGPLYWSLEGSIDADDFVSIGGSVAVINNSATITTTSQFDTSNFESDYFSLKLRESNNGPIVASSDIIQLVDKVVTCSIAESATSIAEGSSITYTVTTSGLDDGTVLTFQSSNTSDVVPASGNITINNNTASFTVAAAEDVFVESDETFTVDVKYANNVLATSSEATIQNTTSYTFTTSATTISENNEVTFTINTTGIPNGTVLNYAASLNNIDLSPSTGSFTINNNTASITIKALQDLKVDTGENFYLDIKTGGTTVATTSTVSITDTPFTIAVTPDQPFNIDESILGSTTSTTFTITTTGVGDGTVLSVLPSTGNNLDISLSSSSIIINNNTATVTATIVRDARTEGVETMNLKFRNTSGDTVITSPTITVTDTSFVGSRQDNKTFGPITVARDNNLEQYASDYYTICGLDSVPDGGKIAIFVDNSGSMTTGTIRASINKLLLRLQPRNISIVVVENPSEDWISSFDTPL